MPRRTLHSAYNGHSMGMHLFVKYDPTLFTLLGNNPKASTWSSRKKKYYQQGLGRSALLHKHDLVLDPWNAHKIQARWPIAITPALGWGVGQATEAGSFLKFGGRPV